MSRSPLRFARLSTAALSLTALATLAFAPGCSSAADPQEATAATSDALTVFKCPPGTLTEDCGYDIGLGGKLIYTCDCVPIPVTPKEVTIAHDSEGGCVLFSDGSVACWPGERYLGADAGYEVVPPTYALTSVTLAKPAIGVAAIGEAYADSTCAVLNDHTVWCWGANGYGELGDGTFLPSTTPKQVMTSGPTGPTPLLATQITGGNDFACAVTTAGGVACWGSNYFGNLGNASVPQGAQAPQVSCSDVAVAAGPLPAAATSVVAGSSHACAVLANGSTYCWGNNSGFEAPGYGNALEGTSLGVGATAWMVPTPAPVLGLPGIPTALSAGHETTCATVGGTLYCWGMIGEAAAPNSPTPVPIGAAPTAFAMGEYDACEIVGGTPECWGTNPATGTYSATPVPAFPASTSATSIAVGGGSACIITAGQHVECVNAANASPVTVF